MSKLNADKIYRWQYTNPYSGWQHEVDLIASDTVNMPEAPEVVIQPVRSLVDLTLEWEYDEFFLGNKLLAGKIILNVNETTSQVDTFIMNPFVSQNYNFSPSTHLWLHNLQYKTGNLFIVRLKDSEGSTIIEIPLIQKTGIESGIDIKTNELEIELIPLERAAMECMSWDEFYYLFLNIETKDAPSLCYLAFMDTYEQVRAVGFAPLLKTDYLWMVRFDVLQTFTKEYYDSIHSKMLRESYSSLDGRWNMPTLYKQLYTGSGGLGASLDYDETYYPGWYATDTVANYLSADVQRTKWQELKEDYPTFYDFFKDHQKMLRTARLSSTTITVNTDELYLSKIKVQSDVVKRVNSTVLKAIGSDIDNVEKVNNSSAGEKGVSIPVICMTNMPAADDYSTAIPNMKKRFNLTDTSNVTYSNEIPWNHFFYLFDDDNDVFAGSQFVKVHEYCIFNFGDGIYSSTYCTNPATDRNDLINAGAKTYAIGEQTLTGTAFILATCWLEILGSDMQAKVEGNIPLFRGYGELPTVNWISGDYELIINLNDFSPPKKTDFYDDYGTQFIITKAKINLFAGTNINTSMVEFEAFTRNI